MYAGRLPLLLLPALLIACGHSNRSSEMGSEHGPTVQDPLAFDAVQHTCALYVAVRSSAWEKPMAFGNAMDDDAIHWNMCPKGNMVACAAAPTADGDSTLTGIPWPYGP